MMYDDLRLLRIASIGFAGMLAIAFAVSGYVIGVRRAESVMPVERASADRIVLGDLGVLAGWQRSKWREREMKDCTVSACQTPPARA